jgi:glycerate kinase
MGPLGAPVEAAWAVTEDALALIELAAASGLALVPAAERDPLRATTFGAGELIRHALERGCGDIILFVGGSATVDGGAGALQALGVRLLDHSRKVMKAPITAAYLAEICEIVPPSSLPCRLRIACDVRNPLLGARGAAAVYGPQKGATPEQVAQLEAGLQRWAELLGGDPTEQGTGAAGGVGFGLKRVLGAELVEAAPLILDILRFNERLERSDLVLTGEGRLDAQTLEGKAVMAVGRASRRAGRPVVAIVGEGGVGAERTLRANSDGVLDSFFSLSAAFGPERARSHPAECIEEAAFRIVMERQPSKPT